MMNPHQFLVAMICKQITFSCQVVLKLQTVKSYFVISHNKRKTSYFVVVNAILKFAHSKINSSVKVIYKFCMNNTYRFEFKKKGN